MAPRKLYVTKARLDIEASIEEIGSLKSADIFAAFLQSELIGEETAVPSTIRKVFSEKCAAYGLTTVERLACVSRILSANERYLR